MCWSIPGHDAVETHRLLQVVAGGRRVFERCEERLTIGFRQHLDISDWLGKRERAADPSIESAPYGERGTR